MRFRPCSALCALCLSRRAGASKLLRWLTTLLTGDVVRNGRRRPTVNPVLVFRTNPPLVGWITRGTGTSIALAIAG